MAAATRSGVDTAGGGLVTTGGSGHVRIAGSPWAVGPAIVAPHGLSPHDAATIPAGSAHVRIAGAPGILAGDVATCGDPATGSGHVEVG